MKTELTTRINVVQENNDQKSNRHIQKNDHIEKSIAKLEEEANQENTYTGKLTYHLSDKLTPKVNELDQNMKDQFENAISKAVSSKLENAEVNIMEDMFKMAVGAKI